MPAIAIIGGGPAGSAAAIALSRLGQQVTLFEQRRFPRDKVCGGCLSAMGIAVLQRLGVADRVEALGPSRLSRVALVGASGRGAALELPAQMWGVTRSSLDLVLLDAAAAAGAEVCQRHRCEAIEAGRDGALLRVRDLDANQVRQHRCDLVVLADGKAALAGQDRGDARRLGIQARFAGARADPQAIALFALPAHYCGLALMEDGLWNVAMTAPRGRVRRSGGDLEALWRRLLRENAGLRSALGTARRCSSWLASPLPCWSLSARWPRRVILVGNAAAAIDPAGGEGMGLALRSAELAAAAIAAAPDGKVDVASLRRQYRLLWMHRAAACGALARALESPALSACAPLAQLAPRTARWAMRLAGK